MLNNQMVIPVIQMYTHLARRPSNLGKYTRMYHAMFFFEIVVNAAIRSNVKGEIQLEPSTLPTSECKVIEEKHDILSRCSTCSEYVNILRL